MADALAERTRREALALIEEILALAYNREAGPPPSRVLWERDESDECRWLQAEWDSWDAAGRRCQVFDVVFKGAALIGLGAKLRELRSGLVESWLSHQQGVELKTPMRKA